MLLEKAWGCLPQEGFSSTSVNSSVFLPWSLVRIENGPIFCQRHSTLFPLSDYHTNRTQEVWDGVQKNDSLISQILQLHPLLLHHWTIY